MLQLVLVSFSVGLGLAAWAIARANTRHWKRVADEAGLVPLDHAPSRGLLSGSRPVLEGRRGRLIIRVSGSPQRLATRIVITRFGWADGELSFRSELSTDGGVEIPQPNFGHRELSVGDPSFDDIVALSGSPAPVLALLDAEMRLMLVELVQGHARVPGAAVGVHFAGRVTFRNDSLIVELRSSVDLEAGPRLESQADAVDVIPRLLDLAGWLVRPLDVPARLAHNARHDRLVGIRLRNLTILHREFPHFSLTKPTLREALSDESDQLRLEAAVALGQEGRDTLLALAETPGSDEVSAAAIRSLDTALGVDRCLDLLTDALRSARSATAIACLGVLGRHGGERSIARLAQVLALGETAEAVAAARALGDTEDPRAEAPLVKALSLRAGPLLVVVVEALGRAGTAAAVLPLNEAAQHASDRRFRNASHLAVAAIQARIVGADRGQLSLTDADVGQLSLVDDGPERGALSLVEGERQNESAAPRPPGLADYPPPTRD